MLVRTLADTSLELKLKKSSNGGEDDQNPLAFLRSKEIEYYPAFSE